MKNKISIFPTISFVIIFVLMIGVASATEFYVSTSGHDSNSGLSPEEPWLSPYLSVSKVQPGDTIYLMAGVWYGEEISIETSGTKNEPITITSYNGEAILDGLSEAGSSIKASKALSMYNYSEGFGNILISDIIVRNYSIGIYSRGCENITIDNVEVYNTSSIGVYFVDSHDSSLQNSDIHDNGWNSVMVQSNFENSSGISILDNSIHDNPGTSGGSGHNMVDFFTYGAGVSIENIDVKDNVIYNGGLANSAIFTHGNSQKMSNMNISDNVIYNTRQLALDRFADSVISNNLIFDQPGYGITSMYVPMDNVLMYNNTMSNVSWSQLRVKGSSINNYLILEENDLSYYRIDGNYAKILNPLKSVFTVRSCSSQITVEFSDGKVFMEDGVNNSIFTPISSSYTTSGDESITFRTYPMVVNPSSSNVAITVNDFDMSESLGNILIDFTASSTDGNNVEFTVNELQAAATYLVKMDGNNFKKVVASETGSISFNNGEWSEHTFTVTQLSLPVEMEQPPVTSGTGLSFTPTAPTFESAVGDSTNFVVSSDQTFTSSTWYLNDAEVASGATTYTQNWNTAGTHAVRFDGSASAGTISRTWTVTVPEPENTATSTVSIAPSSTVVAPGDSFTLDVYIDPGQPLSGSQFNLQYSSIVSASSVSDGGLFDVEGLSSTFQTGQIDNFDRVIRGVYSAIVGSGTISTAGTMATVDMIAGSTSGLVDFTLSNVVLSDASSNPASYDVSYASVLVDTAPEFATIPSVRADETDSISFTVAAADAEGDDLTYSGTSLPGSATFDANTATFSWTPAEGDAGTYTASFAVTDGYLSDSVSATIIVDELNSMPVITLFEPADGMEFEEGSTVDINVAGTDSDGQSLSYIIKINGGIVSTSTYYSWVTDYSSAGTYTITAIVSDGIDDVSSTHTITITDLHPRWDVNEDSVVNVLDITLVGQNYGCTYESDCPRWDVNQDGTVNIQDLSIVSGHFGETV